MALVLSSRAAITSVSSLLSLIDAGSGPGVFEIYDGAPPTNADAAVVGNLLVSFTLADPAFNTPTMVGTDARATANGLPILMRPVRSGTASWFRVVDSDGRAVYTGDVGTLDSNDATVSTAAFVTTREIRMTSLSYSRGISDDS